MGVEEKESNGNAGHGWKKLTASKVIEIDLSSLCCGWEGKSLALTETETEDCKKLVEGNIQRIIKGRSLLNQRFIFIQGKV